MSKTMFDEFQPVSAKQWKQKIQVDLKGKDYNETLVWKTPEGVDVKPFYTYEDCSNPLTIDTQAKNWKICQPVFVNDAEKSNQKAQSLLESGVDSIYFILPSAQIEVETLVQKLPADTTLHFKLEFLSEVFIEHLLKHLSHKNVFIEVDVIGHLTKTGNWFNSLKQDHKILENLLSGSHPQSTLLNVQSQLYQNAGATIVQQLAYTLAHANEYLNHYHHLLNPNQPAISFNIAVGSNYFFEIAKLRALRLLYSALADEYGLHQNCHILASPSKRNKTLYDYNTNLLRTTSECMSAILGGANTVLNLPYDVFYKKSHAFSERIARNQLLILKHESYFNAVNNPASGAYYIESLTHDLAEKALALFKDIEASGGFLKQLKEGIIQRKIKESAQKEQEAFQSGKLVLLGTNKHPNPKDKMKNELELYPFIKQRSEKTLIEPIIETRLSEKTEQERLKTE
ncbi:MAG TPA: methylmalonyl-CoA mutase subunit beta [Flavobacteriaceae bacterium]|nr:methylmalonyl-CoA mutase subunit beta [Flavobacteriaceae bacterium]